MSPEFNPNDPKSVDNCISKGLYCANPKYDLGVSDGKEILKENIRQKCIYLISKGKYQNTLYAQEANKKLYWDYMEKFYDKCLNRTVVHFTSQCSTESQKEIGINEQLVSDCVMSSYVAEKDKVAIDINNNNTILEEEYNIKKKWKIKIFPTIIVNNKTLEGSYNTDNLLEAICAGISIKPQICYDKGYFFRLEEKEGISFSTVFLIILILVILNIIVYLICRRYIIRRINEKIERVDINGRINTVVTSYLALKDPPRP